MHRSTVGAGVAREASPCTRAWEGQIAEPPIGRALPHAVVMTVHGLGACPVPSGLADLSLLSASASHSRSEESGA
jgi:hypothetical protein